VLLVAITMPLHAVLAQETKDTVNLSDVDVVEDSLEILPRDPVSSVFGFGKTLTETPRGVTSISNELMNSVIITEIDDLVAMAPGTFTQSFFGVAGSLDVRGSNGENYFRGVRRIDNPGNYPQAIGASDRIDIVRGPASPIYGPSKIGGYLNFVPKSARASTGQYLLEPKGEFGVTTGSWSKKVLHAEVGGPGEIFGKPLGYYLYGESENSGSYYENTSTLQSIVQASFDMKLTEHLRTEFGGMYQDFKGNQVAGWNRLTQALVDNGTYITGSPASRDTNGDGLLSNAESAGLFGFSPFTLPSNAALLNPGTTHINGSQVLVQQDDTLEDQVLTLYADFIYELPGGLKVTNKSFYESLDNLNENAYGFSQFAKTWAFEDQLIFAFGKQFNDFIKADFQVSPSVRYQNFEHGDDFDFEYFDRRDITKPGSPIDRRTLATRGQDPYSDHVKGHYTDSGLGILTDVTFWQKLNLIAGVRYDNISMNATSQLDSTTNPGLVAADTKGATSWSGSLSYSLPFGFRPYFTRAKQSTLIVGQGGQIDPDNIRNDKAVGNSELTEYGIKGTFLNGHLYAALDHFSQERVDLNAQDTVTSNTTKSEGEEFEFTWVVLKQLSLTGAYTNLKVYNLSALSRNSQFSFLGAEDLRLRGVNPITVFGGVVGASLPITSGNASRKAGIPQELLSFNIIGNLDQWFKGVTASVGITHVSSVYSGYSKAVKLPAYTLVNAGIHYESGRWKLGLQGKNLTDEKYFRSNFPDLFGSSIVLPELPRNYILSLAYKF
jgi:iron complex outermembrane recepter protein